MICMVYLYKRFAFLSKEAMTSVFNMPAILIPNLIGIALMCMLLLNRRFHTRTRFLDDRIFGYMIAINLFQCVGEPLSFLLDGQHFFLDRPLSLLINTCLYVNVILFSYLWVVYIDYKLLGLSDRVRRVYPLLAIPALVMIALLIVNLFTGIFFSVSPENVYTRSRSVFSFYTVVYFYLIYSIVFVYLHRRQIRKYYFFPVVLFLAPVFIGSIGQVLRYGLSLLWVSTSVALVSLYINLQNETSYIDSLTGLYNRQYLNHFLDDYAQRHNSRKKMLGGIMLDVDAFKSINDTFGHCTGDDALMDAGILLHDAVGADAFAARFGGDEFVILMPVTDPAEMKALTARIRAKAELFNQTQQRAYQLSFSMGESTLAPEDRAIKDFLQRMDENMYAAKKAAH